MQVIYIIPVQQLFRGLCGHAAIIHFLTVSHYCYGFCEVSGWGTPWPLISSPALQRPFTKSHYNVYNFCNKINCLSTRPFQLEQWAGEILCAEGLTQLSQHPNPALCSRWPQSMETQGEVCTLRTPSIYHAVSIKVSVLVPVTGITLGKNKTLEQRRKWPWKAFLLILPYIH